MLLIFWASNIGAIEKMNTVKDIYENTNIGAYPWYFCKNWKERVSRPINYLYIYIYVIRHRAHGSNKYHVEVNSRHDLHCQHKGNRTATDTSKSNWALFFFQNIKHKTIISHGNSTSRYLRKRNETYIHTKTCTERFMAAL